MDVWNGIKDFFVNLWNGITDFVTSVLNGISDFFTSVWTGIRDFFVGIWTAIYDAVSLRIRLIKAVMLMWSHYAKYHQGFCVEYETQEYSDDSVDIYHNLFPVIYTDTRTPLTEITLSWNLTGTLTNENLWDFYKYCLLSKSLDWKYQQEWRLISYDTLITDENYNCKFFKIKRVYLGNKMSAKDRLEIIDICKSKGIPYTGVTIASDQFSMRDCATLCEDCDRIKQYIQSHSDTT